MTGRITTEDAVVEGWRAREREIEMPLGGAMPTREEMAKMPEPLRDEILDFASRRIGALLLPMMRLRRSARERQVQDPAHVGSAGLTPRSKEAALSQARSQRNVEAIQALRTSLLLEDWPESALQRMAAEGRVLRVNPGEWVIDEGDNHAGVWALLSGTVTLVRRADKQGRLAGSRIDGPQTQTAPAVFEDVATVADTSHVRSIQTQTICGFLAIPKRTFLTELSQLPADLRRTAQDLGYRYRERAIPQLFPMNIDKLRQIYIFEFLDPQALQDLVSRLRPKFVPAKANVCLEHEEATELFLLRKGVAEVLLPGNVIPIQCPACIGELGFVYSERRTATVRAKTHLDLWALQYSDLQVVFRDPRLREKVQAAANRQRYRWLQLQKQRGEAAAAAGRAANPILEWVKATPVLRESCTAACLEELATNFEPRVYARGDLITSSADICDRVLIIARGRARVMHNGDSVGMLTRGDASGYTCVAEHRWLFALQARDCCDVWVLPRARLIEILRKHSVLGVVQGKVQRVMFAALRRIAPGMPQGGPRAPPDSPQPQEQGPRPQTAGAGELTSPRQQPEPQPGSAPQKSRTVKMLGMGCAVAVPQLAAHAGDALNPGQLTTSGKLESRGFVLGYKAGSSARGHASLKQKQRLSRIALEDPPVLRQVAPAEQLRRALGSQGNYAPPGHVSRARSMSLGRRCSDGAAQRLEEALHAVTSVSSTARSLTALRRAAAAARSRPTSPATKADMVCPGRIMAWDYRPVPTRRFHGLRSAHLTLVRGDHSAEGS